jgi:hypothetical protein
MHTGVKRAGIGLAAAALVAGVGGAATTLPASASQKAHTLRFNSFTIAGPGLGPGNFAGAEIDKRKGDVIGYDSVTDKLDRTTHVLRVYVAFALRGGILHVAGHQRAGVFTGRVTGGSGRFKGASGTVHGTQLTGHRKVVITYTL